MEDTEAADLHTHGRESDASTASADSALCVMIVYLAKIRSLLYSTCGMVAQGSR